MTSSSALLNAASRPGMRTGGPELMVPPQTKPASHSELVGQLEPACGRPLLLPLCSSWRTGVFYAELNELLMRELATDGYSGVEVRNTPMRVEIIIRATRTQMVLGEKGRRIRELTSVVQKRFEFKEGTVELYAEKVASKGLCAVAQAESLRYKLLGGLAVRRACYGVLRFIMESNAKGCEVQDAPSSLIMLRLVAQIRSCAEGSEPSALTPSAAHPFLV